MADSLFSSLRATLDQAAIGQIAGSLGQPEQTVSHGIVSSIAAMLSGLAAKADDPAALRSVVDAAPAGEVSWRQVAAGVADPSSPLIASGKRLLGNIFGNSEGAVINGIGREFGMGTGAVSTLMASVAPLVMSFIGNRVREGHMNMTDLGETLRRESGSLRAALPAGLRDLFWPATETRVPPVAAQARVPERHSNWVPALLLGLIGLALIWFLGYNHMRRTTPAPSGVASRAGNLSVTLPNGVRVNLPQGSTGATLLNFVQNPNAQVDNTSWFQFDRMFFKTNSAKLETASQQQIDNVAAILTAYPNLRVEIAGFTDATGNPAANMQLARNRAQAVKDALVADGVPSDHMTTQSYGPQNPAANNATEAGQAMNRRVVLHVVQK